MSEDAEMQVSMDPRDKEVLQKRRVLETELLGTPNSLRRDCQKVGGNASSSEAT